MERNRTEFLRERGFELEDYHEEGIVLAVTEVNAKYRRSARYNNLLKVESKLTRTSSVN
jgi:acyl-CoA thioester hydrolase